MMISSDLEVDVRLFVDISSSDMQEFFENVCDLLGVDTKNMSRQQKEGLEIILEETIKDNIRVYSR